MATQERKNRTRIEILADEIIKRGTLAQILEAFRSEQYLEVRDRFREHLLGISGRLETNDFRLVHSIPECHIEEIVVGDVPIQVNPSIDFSGYHGSKPANRLVCSKHEVLSRVYIIWNGEKKSVSDSQVKFSKKSSQ